MAIPVRKRILIWGKTYPELSKKYLETVCTGGVFEDDGSPVRLYPIPFRYLNEGFKKYQWITASVWKNETDARPESYKIDWNSIEYGDVVPSDDEWKYRRSTMFKNPNWQYQTAEELFDAHDKRGVSIGVVAPGEILDIAVAERSNEDLGTFEQKMKEVRRIHADKTAQIDMFEGAWPEEMRNLDFVRNRLKIKWRCDTECCSGHNMNVLDWETMELQRKVGDEKALEKLKDICNQDTHDLKFFLGNIYLHPSSFTIVGLWYPKRGSTPSLF